MMHQLFQVHILKRIYATFTITITVYLVWSLIRGDPVSVGAAVCHHRDVADHAVKHRVDHREEQSPDRGGARLTRGVPLPWQHHCGNLLGEQTTAPHSLNVTTVDITFVSHSRLTWRLVPLLHLDTVTVHRHPWIQDGSLSRLIYVKKKHNFQFVYNLLYNSTRSVSLVEMVKNLSYMIRMF